MELDWYEHIGLCAPGEAEGLLRDGATTLGGRVPVNPSGGLACFGEAVPAQAIAQVCELTWQLRGQAGDRQVEGARVGITANQGLFGHGSSVLLSTDAGRPWRPCCPSPPVPPVLPPRRPSCPCCCPTSCRAGPPLGPTTWRWPAATGP